jgi:hypothetical protein
VRYDSIQPGFELQELAYTLVLHPGTIRGSATTEDSTSVWQLGTGNSYWWRVQDSVFVMLSNGQFELWWHLDPSRDTLRGWVEYQTDVGGVLGRRARVVANRKQCRRV